MRIAVLYIISCVFLLLGCRRESKNVRQSEKESELYCSELFSEAIDLVYKGEETNFDRRLILDELIVYGDTSFVVDFPELSKDSDINLSDSLHFIYSKLRSFSSSIRRIKINTNCFEKLSFVSTEIEKKWHKWKSDGDDSAKFVPTYYYQFSTPYLSRDKKYLAIELHAHCFSLCGGGSVLLFKRENGEWVFYDKKSLWIS